MKEIITFDDFTRVDIRIGTILFAEIVEDADKLLKLRVDLGEDQARSIVSGIRERVEDPGELVGRQFPFVVNIPPRTIRGNESNGMVLAGGEGETFTFLMPTKEVPPGTTLH
jgi:methionyl-tRNA synthetase